VRRLIEAAQDKPYPAPLAASGESKNEAAPGRAADEPDQNSWGRLGGFVFAISG